MSEGFGLDIEEVVEDIEEGESEGHGQKTVRMKQTTLDALWGCSGSVHASCSSVPSPPRKRAAPTKSFSVSTTVVDVSSVPISPAQPRRSIAVVQEVDRPESTDLNRQEIQRMSATIQRAKERRSMSTLDAHVTEGRGAHDDSMQPPTLTEQEPDLEGLRSYAEPYPDLNEKKDNDAILISVGSIRPNSLPRPYPPACTDPVLGWNRGRSYVRLPFSSLNVVREVSHYELITTQLNKLTAPLTSPRQIQECIEGYSRRNWRFDALDELFQSVSEQLAREYLSAVVPFMARLALSAPRLITQPLPILRQGNEGSVTVSQQQAAALLAHAFFCTFPCRANHLSELPPINFNRLFDLRTGCSVEKLKCIFHYFHQISVQMPTGVLTYRRQRVGAPEDWRAIGMPLSELVVSSVGSIEDQGVGMLQVDFANQYIGGGVLGSGCVQEEIRFLVCPEMILSMLLCERMDHNESIVILGAQRYSDYVGYGHSFQWYPLDSPDNLSRDRFERLRCELVAIDALPFSKPQRQYNIDLVDRELLKAYSGFCVRDGSSKAVATGNWGCGVFGGDPQLKSVIQMMAASMHARPLCYFTFGNRELAHQLTDLYKQLHLRNVHTNELYDLVALYCLEWAEQSPSLFEFIHNKLIDGYPGTAG